MNIPAIIMHDGSTVGEVIRKTAKGNETAALYFLQVAAELIGQSDGFVVKSGASAGAPSIDPDLIAQLWDVEDGESSGMKFTTFRNTYVKMAERILRSIGCEDSPIDAYNFLQDCHEEGSVSCWNLQTVAAQVKALFVPVESVEDVEDVEDVESVETQQDKLARLQQILAQLDADSLTVAAHMVDAAQTALVVSDDRIYNEAY